MRKMVMQGENNMGSVPILFLLEPIWEKRSELIANPQLLREISEKGTDKARKVAEETMRVVREAIGLG